MGADPSSDLHTRQASRLLLYFADPMCSWCWGFAPVIASIVETYRGRLEIALVVGGLRPGSTTPISAALRDDILHHWHEVNRVTGQPFTFEGALPAGFVYDTEPPCRAAITMPELNPQATFPFFGALQSAFYLRHEDITRADTLARLASAFDVDAEAFRARSQSAALHDKVQRHFNLARQLGIRGFPTAVLADQRGQRLLTHGFRDFEALQPTIDEWLASAPAEET